MLVNALPRSLVGKVGETRKFQGNTYRKSRNGKWQLVPSAKLKRAIHSAYVVRRGTLRSVADELGLTQRVVQQVVDAEGWDVGKAELRDRNKELLERHAETILRLYARGDSCQDIAKQLGISSGVRAYVRKLGLMRSPGEQQSLNMLKFKDRYEDGMLAYTDRCIAIRVRKAEFSGFEQYKHCIVQLTKLIVDRHWQHIDPKCRQSRDYNIDHQFSKFYGWYEFSMQKERMLVRKTPVPLSVICHPANLKLLPAKMNSAKGNMCHISLSALRKKIREFDKKHGKVFQ